MDLCTLFSIYIKLREVKREIDKYTRIIEFFVIPLSVVGKSK